MRQRATGLSSFEEHEAIKAGLPPDEGDLVEYLLWSGWRSGEALGLRWKDVDERAQVIRIEKTKSGRPRTLPYGRLPQLVAVIEKRRATTDEVQKRKGVIVRNVFARDGEPILYFRGSWAAACVRAGLGEEIRSDTGKVVERRLLKLVHDYRRSFARNMSRAGVPEATIMKLAGWATASIFLRYNIVSEGDLGDGLARMAAMVERSEPAKVTRMQVRG